jgi:hypothetical protein
LRRALLAAILSVFALLSLVLVASQVEQRLFRKRAELLLAEIQSLQLRKVPWREAQTQFQHWNTNCEFDNRCNEQKCSLTISLNQIVLGYISKSNLFVHLDDYFRWRLKLHYDTGPFVRLEQALFRSYMRMGGRPARVVATVGMHDGIVWSKGFSVLIETYAKNGPWTSADGGRVEYTLIADARSVPRIDYYGRNWADPQVDSPLGLRDRSAGWMRNLRARMVEVYSLRRPDGCSPPNATGLFMPDSVASLSHSK